MRKNLEIERLRAVAVVMVVVFHSRSIEPLFHPLLKKAWTGVDLFFVISGYVVTLSFLRLLPALPDHAPLSFRIRSALPALKTFYLRRVFRILPAACVWICAYFVLSVIFEKRAAYLFGTPGHLFKEAVYFFSGFYNYLRYEGDLTIYYIGHYWSLTVEEHFYFVLPMLMIVTWQPARRIAAVLACILAVIALFRPFIPSPSGIDPIAFSMFASHRRFDSLFIGVLLALIGPLPVPQGSPPESDKGRWKLMPVPILLIGLLWVSPAALPSPFNVNMGFTVYALYSAGLVYLASLERGYIFSVPYLDRALVYLGSRSYSIYLSHVAVIALHIQAMNDFSASLPSWFIERWYGNAIQFGLAALVIIVLSELTYRFVERPMIKVGRKLAGGQE